MIGANPQLLNVLYPAKRDEINNLFMKTRRESIGNISPDKGVYFDWLIEVFPLGLHDGDTAITPRAGLQF